MTTDYFPVVIVGAGPTGLVLAHLLGVYGVRALLIDRGEATVGEARAVSIDDESLRSLQTAGVLPEVIADMTQGYGVHYYSWRNRLFARIDPTAHEYGFQRRNAFRQEVLARQLCNALAKYPHIAVRFKNEVESFEQDSTGVTVQVQTQAGLKAIRCDYLAACDGGRSTIREKLDIPLEGDTFAEQWLIVDMIGRQSTFRHTRTYCDPARACIRLPGPHATVRYEFMLKEGESQEAVLEERQLRNWIAKREPADADLPIVRKVVYTFHARVAARWRDGRVFLCGDAAHLTPPFAGQGMNSGVRDATNLAWKLAAVVNGELPPRLLDSYEKERKPHAWALIQMALRIGKFMQPKTVLGAAFNQSVLRAVCVLPAARDYILQLKFKPKPRFREGFFIPAQFSMADGVVPGQLLPQPTVELPGGKTCLLDDVLGTGFAIIQFAFGKQLERRDNRLEIAGYPNAPRIEVLRRSEDFLAPALVPASGSSTRSLTRSPMNDAPETGIRVRDIEGVLTALLENLDAQALVVRPDRYIFAAIPATGTGVGSVDLDKGLIT